MRSRKVFTFARDADPGYIEQLNSEVRIKEAGKAMWRLRKGVRDNHAFDCELLGMLIAARWGLLGRDEPQTLPAPQ
jgi:hypothetical protein